MNISKIFSKKERLDTDALVGRFREIKVTKAELEMQAAELKQQALYRDVKELGPQLAQVRLEIELSDAGLAEIQNRLESQLADEIAAAYQALPDRKEAYEAALAENFQECGRTLANAVFLLGLSRKGALTRISSAIQAEFADLADGPRADEFRQLIEAFNDYQAPADAQDLKAERREIETVERRSPGSAESQNWIRNTVRKLLDPQEVNA